MSNEEIYWLGVCLMAPLLFGIAAMLFALLWNFLKKHHDLHLFLVIFAVLLFGVGMILSEAVRKGPP